MGAEAKVGTIYIGMRAGVGGLKKDLGSARAELSGFESFVGGLKVAAGAFAGLAVVRGSVGFLADAARAASDLYEQIDAAGATFGPASAKIDAGAKQMARDFGVVKKEFYESANGLGAIFKSSGFTADSAAGMAVEFTKLAADLASLRNLSFEESLQKIKAGLVGEAEPLRSVGVLLSEAAVQQEAYTTGIAAYGAKLTEAQARAAIITHQLSDAQGNLAQTSGSVANQMKALTGRVENFKADAGAAIASVTSALTTGLNVALIKMAGLWGENSDGVKAWADASVKEGGSVSNAISVLASGLGFVADTLQLVKFGFLSLQYTVTKFVAVGLALLGNFALGLERTIKDLTGIEFTFGRTIDAMARGVDAAAEEQYANLKSEWSKPWASEGITKFFDDLKQGAESATVAASKTTTAVEGVASAQVKLAGDVAALTDDLKEQVATFGMSSTEAKLYKLAQEGATEADLAQAKALAGQLQAMEASAEVRKQMEADAKSLFESTRTDAEKAAVETAKAQQLLAAGLIDQNTFDRAIQGQADTARAPTAGALEAGSQEARSAVLAFQRQGTGKDPIDDVKKNTGQQVQLQARTNDLLGSLLDRLAAAGSEAVLDLFPAA